MKDIATRIVFLGCLVLLMVSHVLDAAPVPPATAEKAARAWMRSSRAPGIRRSAAVKHSRRVSFRHGGIESAANLITLDGGGFVVVAPDDRIEPVIFHSPNGTVSETDDGGPFWALMKADMAYRMATVNEAETGTVVNVAFAAANNGSQRRELSPQESVEAASSKWAALLADEPEDEDVRREILFGDGVSSISDVRVAPLLDSSWGQDRAGGDYCYNYYTPNHYVCGCVATAVSQVMRYHKYPTASVAAGTYVCSVDGVVKSLTMKGGTYSWGSMPGNPTSSLTTAQRQAIGKLCYDVGVACEMDYSSGESGASSFRPVYVLKQVFKYSNVLPVTYTYSNYSWTLDRFKSIIVPNCDAGLPVLASVPGHAIVADGYGYDSNLFYVHLNMGWDGLDNLWYNPPAVYTSYYLFSGFQGLMANICTTQTAGASIASGRVLSSSGSPISGASVRATCSGKADITGTTNAKGMYGLVLPAGTWTITATSGTATGTKTVTMSGSSGTQTFDDGSYNPYVVPVINNLYDQTVTLAASQTYTISFNVNGGSPTPSSITRKANEAYGTLPTPTRTGYAFDGWYTAASGGTKVSSTTKATASTTLHAHWTANTYSVSYSLGSGGSHGSWHPVSATYDTPFYVSAPTRSGCAFAGWTVTYGLNTSTAKWGTGSSPSTAIGSTSTKCVNGTTGNVYFKNLTPTANGSVTLTANWDVATIPLGTALDNTTLTFTTGGSANWFGQSDLTHDGTDAARSGKIGDGQNTWMQTTVTGSGIISFWWYASSESERYDYLAFSIDGTEKARIGGTSGAWNQYSYLIESAGSHTLTWTYVKDGSVSNGLDAGFVDQVVWTDNIVTEVRNLGIGFVSGGELYELTLKNGGKIAFYDAWLTDAGISTSGGITTSLLNAIGRNGLPRYQSYLFGFDPESTIPAEEQLKPTIEFDAAGTPIISCIPKMLNDLVTYTTLGKPSLNAADWVEVTPSNKASMRFFKVKVKLAK